MLNMESATDKIGTSKQSILFSKKVGKDAGFPALLDVTINDLM